MSIERMLVSGATHAIGADAARIFTRKRGKASTAFIVVIALASSIYGWLYLMRRRSKWWQRILAVPMIIGGSMGLAIPVVPIFAQSPFAFLIIPGVAFVIGAIAVLVSNNNYTQELKTANEEAVIISANDAFLTEKGLSSMDNWDLFHDESGSHFKRISDFQGGVLYSIVGLRGGRAKLTLDNGKFMDFEILDQKPLKGLSKHSHAANDDGSFDQQLSAK